MYDLRVSIYNLIMTLLNGKIMNRIKILLFELQFILKHVFTENEKILTDTRIMINHAKYSIASSFHMIVGTYTAKHWR